MILDFFKKSPASAPFEGTDADVKSRYRKLQLSSFIAATLGYSLYYVCRTTLNVVKKPIIDGGILDATELGVISSALLFAYAIGKFINGFLADHSNIKRFMAFGLLVSTVANLVVGCLGFFTVKETAVSMGAFYLVFAIFWGINGYAQSMGAPPAIISLSRWFPLSTRGTYYGFFSASHNLGEWFSFLLVGGLVSLFGWQYGFIGAAIAGILGVIIVVLMLHDSPESMGMPPIEVYAGETTEAKTEKKDVGKTQLGVIKNPYVWVLALASAFMYVSRYAINGWGVLFLQETKAFTLAQATQIISINALLGIFGTVFSGWLSDKVFKGNRYILAVSAGVLEVISLILFAYCGTSYVANVIAMVLFGLAIGVLICFVGGLMAVDIVPREATGAALGVVGMASYAAAGLQDIVSGMLLDGNKVGDSYNFTPALWFWIAAAAVSVLLVCVVWHKAWKNKKSAE